MKRKIVATKAIKKQVLVRQVNARRKPLVQVNETLSQRGTRYGKFSDHAAITQALKSVIRGESFSVEDYKTVQVILAKKWIELPPNMKEALEMTMHKIGRIMNGDHNYADSWHDIVGYNKLVDDKLNGVDI
jgi:hypothetical protein